MIQWTILTMCSFMENTVKYNKMFSFIKDVWWDISSGSSLFSSTHVGATSILGLLYTIYIESEQNEL